MDLLQSLASGTTFLCETMTIGTITSIQEFILMALKKRPGLIDVSCDGIES